MNNIKVLAWRCASTAPPQVRVSPSVCPIVPMRSSSESRTLQRRPANIALTGFMAAGKSSAGRALAQLLKWSFIDLDCEIERLSRRSIRDIFAQQGESKFREIEAEALRSILEAATGSTVIALGGGTFVEPKNATLLRDSGVRVIFLELPLEQLLQRCRALGERCGQNPRPLAENEQAFCALYTQRLPSYRQADLVVNAEGKTPEQIAGEIANAMK